MMPDEFHTVHEVLFYEEESNDRPMAPRHSPKSEPKNTPPESGTGPSQDRERHREDSQHHPYDHPLPHPPHHPHEHPTLAPRHYPHTQPEEFALDMDHGTHEDRPRPGKIAKKGNKNIHKP
jgi:hypothetical protein